MGEDSLGTVFTQEAMVGADFLAAVGVRQHLLVDLGVEISDQAHTLGVDWGVEGDLVATLSLAGLGEDRHKEATSLEALVDKLIEI